MQNFTKLALIACTFCFLASINAQNNRSIDGTNNNLIHTNWGAVGSTQLNFVTTGYIDGGETAAGQDRPNARFISNQIFAQNTLQNDPRGLSSYCWGWGQFIDHDITLVHDEVSEFMPISVPAGDVFFDQAGTGAVAIPMHRSEYDPNTGNSIDNPRQFINSITSFIDASAIYGSSEERASWLRTYSNGKLKTSSGNLLPYNTTTGEKGAPINISAPSMAMPFPQITKWFVAGDLRANENPFLLGMHTLFVREHNRLCEELLFDNPNWTDEQLYQYARKIVGAEMQAIVYEEWLPTMGMSVLPYNGYGISVNPAIMNVFSAAAYRYGHTTINSHLLAMNDDGTYQNIPTVALRDAFFNPNATTAVGGIEPYLIGMATVVQQDFDCKVIDDIRNFLFGAPGAGGLDLAAINIARGRDRGLPDYNTIRMEFGLTPISNFSEMSTDPLMNQSLGFIYGDVEKIDPWVGMLAENHLPDALFGHTAMKIIEQQFMALRDGDRFYYENDPALPYNLKQDIKNTRLSHIIRRNTPITIVQDDIFMAAQLSTAIFEKPSASIAFELYPNPIVNKAFLKISTKKAQEGLIQIIDSQGKTILERPAILQVGNNTFDIDIPNDWHEGIYWMTLKTEQGIGQKMFFKFK